MQFLSTEWFTKVAQLRADAGPMELPNEIAESIINVTVTDTDQVDHSEIHIAGGEFGVGHRDNAEVTISLASSLLRKVFLELDTQAGMQAFFAGEITVDGDMTKLMALQNYQPNEEQKKLLNKVVAITE